MVMVSSFFCFVLPLSFFELVLALVLLLLFVFLTGAGGGEESSSSTTGARVERFFGADSDLGEPAALRLVA